MALARAEIPPISGFQFISGGFHADSSVSQSVFPGPNPLVLQRPRKYSVFPEGHRQGRWPAAGPGFPADSACMGDEIGQIGLICRAILHAPAKETLLARACPAEVARESAESKGGSEPTQAEFFNLPRRRTTGALRAACLSLSTAHAMHSGYLLQPFFFFCS